VSDGSILPNFGAALLYPSGLLRDHGYVNVRKHLGAPSVAYPEGWFSFKVAGYL